MNKNTETILDTLAKAKDQDNYRHWLASKITNMTTAEFLDFHQEIKKLIHHKDSTIGLWATDKPGLLPVNFKHGDMFFKVSYPGLDKSPKHNAKGDYIYEDLGRNP